MFKWSSIHWELLVTEVICPPPVGSSFFIENLLGENSSALQCTAANLRGSGGHLWLRDRVSFLSEEQSGRVQ